MKRVSCLVCVLIALLPLAGRADLASDIRPVLEDKLLRRATVGIEVTRLGKSSESSDIVYKLNAAQRFIPASNLKMVTTSAALDRLGPDFKFRTLLMYGDGDLVLIGDGDPSLGDAEMLKKLGWRSTTVFENWAASLKQHNVSSVRKVIVDDSVFDQTFVHPRWPAEQQHKRYVAGVGGVSFNANCIDFFIRITTPGALVGYAMDPPTRFVDVRNSCITGRENAIWLSRELGGNTLVLRGEALASSQAPVSVTVHDPSLFAATVLAETLSANGVQVSGGAARDRSIREAREKAGAAGAGKWKLLAAHETKLPAVLARANKDSMNLYAESLCKRLAFARTHQSGSWEDGTKAVGDFLKQIGVPESQFNLDDGSGLSKENGISPHAMSSVLSYDYFGKNRETFIGSLSVAGVDGTLEERFKGSDLRQRVIGKSGFVEGVSSLSGYLKARDGQMYVFSILMNGIPKLSNSGVKALQERIVRAIDNHAAGVARGGD